MRQQCHLLFVRRQKFPSSSPCNTPNLKNEIIFLQDKIFKWKLCITTDIVSLNFYKFLLRNFVGMGLCWSTKIWMLYSNQNIKNKYFPITRDEHRGQRVSSQDIYPIAIDIFNVINVLHLGINEIFVILNLLLCSWTFCLGINFDILLPKISWEYFSVHWSLAHYYWWPWQASDTWCRGKIDSCQHIFWILHHFCLFLTYHWHVFDISN